MQQCQLNKVYQKSGFLEKVKETGFNSSAIQFLWLYSSDHLNQSKTQDVKAKNKLNSSLDQRKAQYPHRILQLEG